MSKLVRYSILLIAIAPVAFIFQNCGQPGTIAQQAVTLEDATGNPVDPENPPGNALYSIRTLPPSKFICEPFGGGGGGAQNGLRAELSIVNPQVVPTVEARNNILAESYFTPNDSRFIRSDAAVFLSQVNVPTRRFDQGFQLSNGQYLQDAMGNRLIEHFALRMNTVLKLGPNDQPGYYELATISDDGSKVYLQNPDTNQYQVLLDNDGLHSTRMRCANQAIYLDQNSRIPMMYYYNQGPRTEIANVMVWKYHGSSAPNLQNRVSQACEKVSNSLFWNPADSAPGDYWRLAQAEDYRVIANVNFELPGSQVNPCATQNTNLISQAQFSNLVNMQSELTLIFMQAANIKAQLFRVNGVNRTSIQQFDYSAQMRDRVSIPLPVLEVGVEYSLEVLLELPNQGTKVLNEVRFRLEAATANAKL